MIIPAICLAISVTTPNNPRHSMFHNAAFQLVQPNQSKNKDVQVHSIPSNRDQPTEETVEKPLAETGTGEIKSHRSHFRRVSGFGNEVPLGFAVRQFVPFGVRVSFGGDIDTTRLVSWAGGDTWNRVLAATVAQLGYAIDVGHNSVRIITKKTVSSHDER